MRWLRRRREARMLAAAREEGRVLASLREELVIAGVDPRTLLIPVYPEDPEA